MLQRRITRFRAKPNSEGGCSCATSTYAHGLPTFLSSSRNNNKSRNSKSSNNNSTSRRLRHRPRSPPTRAPRLWPVSPPTRRFCWPSLPTHLGGRCRHRLPASPRAPTRLRVEQRWCVILRHHKPSSSYTSRFSGTLRSPRPFFAEQSMKTSESALVLPMGEWASPYFELQLLLFS